MRAISMENSNFVYQFLSVIEVLKKKLQYFKNRKSQIVSPLSSCSKMAESVLLKLSKKQLRN